MNPLVSFLIPCYNHAAFLAETLRSILKQDASGDFEILVQDDASPDDLATVVAEFSDPRILYARNPVELGLVPTLNRVYARARGKYLTRPDGDNCYRPDFLAHTLAVLENEPQLGVVYGEVAAIDVSGKVVQERWNAMRTRAHHCGQPFRGDELFALVLDNFVPLAAMVARREAWAEAFPLPAWFPDFYVADDWYLMVRMARKFQFCYLPRVLADYRLHPSNLHQRWAQGLGFENTTRRILDEFFAEPERAAEKKQYRARAYALLYANLANRYFGAARFADARRCYWRALQFEPQRALDVTLLRHWAATYVGATRYRRWQARWRGGLNPA